MPDGCARPARSSARRFRCTPSATAHGAARSRRHGATCVDLGLVPADLPFGRRSRPSPARPPTASSSAPAGWRSTARPTPSAPRRSARKRCTRPAITYPGHTELLAHLTGTPEVSMMLTTPKLRVIHVTTHIGLIDAIARIEPGLVERTIARGHDTLVEGGHRQPAHRRLRASTRMPARTACSGAARRPPRSSLRSPPAAPGAGRSTGRCRPTPCSTARRAATSTSWSRCITTRATGRSRCWASRPA